MPLKTAIQHRIDDLCREKAIASETLPDPADDLAVVEQICDTLGISLADFFCCDTFRDIEK